LSDSDFGSAFSETPPQLGSEGEPLRITVQDLNESTDRCTVSPQRLALDVYGISLPAPGHSEELFVGLTRNPATRTEDEDYYPVFSSYPRRRQHQIITFEVEIADEHGNPSEHVPVEVRGQHVSGVLPSDGTPVAVYGSRDPQDRVLRTHRVVNLRTGSSIRVTTRSRDWCFVATAVYGSVDAPEVVLLRRFRDRYLMSSCWGLQCVRTYYRVSPFVAEWTVASPLRRRVSRALLDCVTIVLGRIVGS